MMWNLLINGAIDDFCAPPAFDDGSILVSGQRYSNEKVDEDLLVGEERHWTAARYSHEIRDLVRQCLRYEPADRPSLENLRDVITAHITDPPRHDAPSVIEDHRLILTLDRKLDGYRFGQDCSRLKRKRNAEDDGENKGND